MTIRESQKKRGIVVAIVVILLVVIVSLYVLFGSGERASVGRNTVSIRGEEYTLEIADTDSSRSLGLGERDSLCQSCAMLFIFDRPSRYTFWMKGMRFPLDIVWLSGDEVVHIERGIPADSLLTYSPSRPADRVLEFNAGVIDGLSVGDTVQYFR